MEGRGSKRQSEDTSVEQATDKRKRSGSPFTSTSTVSTTTSPTSPSSPSMSHSKVKEPVASLDMCTYCFDVLMAHHFKKADKPTPTFTNDPYPLFVTWKAGSSKRLRGCIGTFTPLVLHTGLKEYALTSAVNDSRFSPISKAEISSLHVSVSILVGFEEAQNYMDWEVGTHGIKIEFLSDRGSTHSATFLPEVASEQGWTREDTVEALLRKGGLKGAITQQVKDNIKLTRYRSEKVAMSFQEYQQLNGQVGELMNGHLTNGHSK